MRRAALLTALALALIPTASAAAARPRVLIERDVPGMKVSFAATRPLTSIKRFLAVYSDEHSRKRDRVELRQCGFRRGTATALFQGSATSDVTKPISVWTAVVECRTAKLARRFSVEERQDVNLEWTKPPTAAKVRRQAASALPHGALAAVAATTPAATGGEKAALTIVLVPLGKRVAVLTLTTHAGFNPYPQARNLMRRMLGLKPIAAPKKKAATPPPLGVPVETARFVRR